MTPAPTPDTPGPTCPTIDTPRNRSVGVLRAVYRASRATVTRLLFERRYNVRTDEHVSLEQLGLAAPDRRGYMPSGWLVLRRILPHHEVRPDDVLLDVGSGMGRVLLQAAMHYPFRRVLGVELSPDLHAIAVDNISRNAHRFGSTAVELACADVTTSPISDDITVIYLYNPFRGTTFTAFLDHVLASLDRNPRTIRLIYTNPHEHAQLQATGRVRLLRQRHSWRRTAESAHSTVTQIYDVR